MLEQELVKGQVGFIRVVITLVAVVGNHDVAAGRQLYGARGAHAARGVGQINPGVVVLVEHGHGTVALAQVGRVRRVVARAGQCPLHPVGPGSAASALHGDCHKPRGAAIVFGLRLAVGSQAEDGVVVGDGAGQNVGRTGPGDATLADDLGAHRCVAQRQREGFVALKDRVGGNAHRNHAAAFAWQQRQGAAGVAVVVAQQILAGREVRQICARQFRREAPLNNGGGASKAEAAHGHLQSDNAGVAFALAGRLAFKTKGAFVVHKGSGRHAVEHLDVVLRGAQAQ